MDIVSCIPRLSSRSSLPASLAFGCSTAQPPWLQAVSRLLLFVPVLPDAARLVPALAQHHKAAAAVADNKSKKRVSSKRARLMRTGARA